MLIEKEYQNKVNSMLDRMPKGQRVRVARITSKKTREKFVEAVKNWMNEQPVDNGGLIFSDDYKFFSKKDIDLDEVFSKKKESKPKEIDFRQATERVKLVKKARARLSKGNLPRYAFNSAEYIHDAKFTLESCVLGLENAKLNSRAFDTHFSKLVRHLKIIDDLDKAKRKQNNLVVYYYQFISGIHSGEYYSHLSPPEIHLKDRENKIKEISVSEAQKLSKK